MSGEATSSYSWKLALGEGHRLEMPGSFGTFCASARGAGENLTESYLATTIAADPSLAARSLNTAHVEKVAGAALRVPAASASEACPSVATIPPAQLRRYRRWGANAAAMRTIDAVWVKLVGKRLER